MGYIIRVPSKNELGQIYELEKQIFEPMNYPLFVIKQFYDFMRQMMLVAVNEQNEVIGYTLGGMNSEEQIGWILSLATRQNYQGQGIGRSITEEILDVLRSKGAKDIHLTAHPENKPAIQLYNKLGFETVEEVQDYYGDGEPRLVMRLKVSRMI